MTALETLELIAAAFGPTEDPDSVTLEGRLKTIFWRNSIAPFCAARYEYLEDRHAAAGRELCATSAGLASLRARTAAKRPSDQGSRSLDAAIANLVRTVREREEAHLHGLTPDDTAAGW